MATIETRKSSDGTVTYRAKVRLRGFPVECASFKRKTDAVQWARGTEASMQEGRYSQTSEAKRHTFSELAQRYEQEVVPLRPKNAANTLRHLRYWTGKLGHLLLSDVTPALLVQCRNELLAGTTSRNTKRSPATVVRYLATISHVFTMAMKEWQWVNDNPARKISKPRQSRGRERFLSDEERVRLLDACRHSTCRYLLPVVVLAISTGMRRGEIMHLRWRDVDLVRGSILLTETKNGSSRSVPLVGPALELLNDMSKIRHLASDLIFYGGIPSKPMDIEKHWKAALEIASIENFRFHDLRHTAASYLAMNGATTMEIAAVLGHKTLQMVKRYSHLTDMHTARVLTAMNAKVFADLKCVDMSASIG
jgi:integrase